MTKTLPRHLRQLVLFPDLLWFASLPLAQRGRPPVAVLEEVLAQRRPSLQEELDAGQLLLWEEMSCPPFGR